MHCVCLPDCLSVCVAVCVAVTDTDLTDNKSVNPFCFSTKRSIVMNLKVDLLPVFTGR